MTFPTTAVLAQPERSEFTSHVRQSLADLAKPGFLRAGDVHVLELTQYNPKKESTAVFAEVIGISASWVETYAQLVDTNFDDVFAADPYYQTTGAPRLESVAVYSDLRHTIEQIDIKGDGGCKDMFRTCSMGVNILLLVLIGIVIWAAVFSTLYLYYETFVKLVPELGLVEKANTVKVLVVHEVPACMAAAIRTMNSKKKTVTVPLFTKNLHYRDEGSAPMARDHLSVPVKVNTAKIFPEDNRI
ncbi:hypothetical protein CYMTET_49835 [Cymbomonas tetramitiformis]|uniref:Uncharacterized protein n=1 Tax=Cymbomonas tetramitiformis TaxID=36881 RepID=A0AAE0ETR7_9CHLO|nr:hypothetical protein CYMTET_49835 [Cymbomonas tetramitiformis]